ncbi:MAG: metal-dependent transcriptional regulator [Thermodesulfobacteriota bacterium]
MTENRAVDELLEFIWTERESGRNSIEKLLAINEVKEAGATYETLKEMQGTGLVRIMGDTLKLTNDGEALAREAVRRHRLAERLLTEVLALDPSSVEKNACDFEHTLSPEVAESICTLLAHPPTCPHGHAIPQGRCCTKSSEELTPLVGPLDKLNIGESGKIIFIASKAHSRLDKLSSLGIVPGSVLKVHQKSPAFVILMGETTLALEQSIIEEIYVKRTW